MTMKNHSRACLILSAAIIALALVLTLCGAGINPGNDFTGSLNIAYNMNQSIDPADAEAVLAAQGINAYSIACSGANAQTLEISVPELKEEARIQSLQSALESALAEKYPDMDAESGKAEYAGSLGGASFLLNTVIGVLLACLLILLTIAFRFDFNTGLATAFGLLHDALITASFMVFLGGLVHVNASFIAAALAVIGLSATNAIILFDRIRANGKKPECKGLSREEMVNLSAKESFHRILVVSLVLLSAPVALCVAGVEGVRELSLPVVVGILSSLYSTNMITGYVWASLEDRRRERKKAKYKAKKA